MTSRLDRLFILLESGSSAVTRRTAAKQIGEVQKLYPHELHNLLNRLVGYLHSSSWETRIAAAQAVEAVLNNVPQWQPKACSVKKEEDNVCDSSSGNDTQLAFESFDLSQVLQRGARLMGSEGTEFDFADDNDSNSSDHLVKQRELLNDKLGFSQASKLGINININDLIALEDMKSESKNSVASTQMIPVQDILRLQPQTSSCQNLSCREMNRARRKARQNNTSSNTLTHSTNLSRSNSLSNGSLDEPERKKVKMESANKVEMYYNINQPVPDATGSWGDAINWPLEQFSSRLFLDLFNAKWEIRHGAATALRELINSHSSGAGKCVYATESEMEMMHHRWIEDATLRLLCVLSLDRFGDFVSDQVVAPVRETCAQVLGTLLKQMPTEKVRRTAEILLQLIKQSDWEVRHGGLLGLKYMFVVREDLLQTFLPMTINDILMGLFDNVDDVGAVAASTLIPVASWLPKLLNAAQVSKIVKMLWDLLLDQDELTSACNSFMGLLAAILCLPNASQWIQMESMSILVPRLWPFLSHSTSSVRRSTLHTLKTLTTNMIITTNISPCTTQTPTQMNGNSSISSPSSPSSSLVADMNFESKTLVLNFGVKEWQSPLLQDALRHVYQRVLIEPVEDIQELCKEVWTNLTRNAELSALLHAACPFVASWICLAMQPARLAFDPSILMFAKQNQNKERRSRPSDDLGGSSGLQQKLYLGGNEATPLDVREKNVMKARVNAAKMLGLLSHYLVQPAPGVVYTPEVESPIDCYIKVLLGYLNSRSSLQRLICGMVIAFWALSDSSARPGPPLLQDKLKICVMEYVYYDEVAMLFTRLLQEAHDFIATLKQYKVPMNDFDNCKILTLDQIRMLCTTMTENLRHTYGLKPKIIDLLEERRRGLQNSYNQTSAEQNSHNVSTQSALAGAIVCLQCLPEKLNPVIKPLMESIKREECELMQQLSAEYLVHLLEQVANRNPSPNNKIVTNLCTLLKSDIDFTPVIEIPTKHIGEVDPDDSSPNPFYGIVTLSNQQKSNEQQNGSLPRGPGRPPIVETSNDDANDSDDPSRKQNRIQRIGANYAIIAICKHFGAQLKEKIPILWKLMFNNIENLLQTTELNVVDLTNININQEITNDLVTSLQLIEIAVPHIHNNLHDDLFELLPKLGVLLTYPLKAIRHMASRCLAAFTILDECRVMKFVVEYILPLLQTVESVIKRQGAAEAIDRVVDKMQLKMIPYVVFLVVPLLGRMSDPDEPIRLISTHCFATLIQLMPLDGGNSGNTISSKELQERRSKDRQFLEYLFAPKTIPDFKVPVDISAELRTYQQAGVNWLWFLNKYNLHGILCDDMGLGKTLQTICILAGDHYQRRIENLTSLPSIVICPPTLTGHWVYEFSKFLPSKFLRPLHYVGLPIGREKLRAKVGAYNLVVVSYDTVRKDIDFFSSINWNYCVLDEGHIIKNGKTKSSKAIKMLKANHRLILSGTPVQNNVLELWSLFDFLMPGFLGTEKQFINRYSRPILASRDPKSSPKEQENGVLAMEALHRQILPFLLRRVKEDVLKDLPPKITQDLLCELSPLQERLYEDFSKTHLNSEIKDCLDNMDETTINKKTHIFQALRYLQNVCNHPKLVLTPNHPEYIKTQGEMAACNKSLDDIEHSAKLPALKQLLLDCGIGVENVSINQHRALIFCQLKAMLNIVENDLLKKHLPAVSYLRLDGSVPASERYEIVTKFNGDPSIDVLLLTTQVGGLGLNLTGADTVIFVEHDWNPMKDLQAMDRAHRIGQKKVVNVYRLITRKSLEEKIMGLQKFKILTANTIVSTENASMETMGTDQLLDLFNLSDNNSQNNGKRSIGGANFSHTASLTAATTSSSNSSGGNNSNNVSMKQIIESLPDLWEEKQYEEEYDLTHFIQGLKK